MIILYRLHITRVLFPNDESLKLIVGDSKLIFIELSGVSLFHSNSNVIQVVSSCLETTFTLLLSAVFKKLANTLTNWENHRTRTMFQDALIVKLFAFEFVNHYGALFYLAYLRNVTMSSEASFLLLLALILNRCFSHRYNIQEVYSVWALNTMISVKATTA